MLYYGILDPNTGIGSIKKRRGEIDFSQAGKNGCKMNTFRPSITINEKPLDFKILDIQLREAKDEGLTNPVLVVDFAESVRLHNSYRINPAFEDDVTKNLVALVKRYPRLKYYELWNEPRGYLNDPKSYSTLIDFFYPIVERVDATKQIVISGEDDFALEVLFYLPAIFKMKQLTFDIHNFGSATNGWYKNTGVVRSNIQDGAKKLGYTLPFSFVSTENSTWCHTAWNTYQTEVDQALDNLKRVVFCWSLGIDLVMAAMGLNEYFLMDQSGDPFAWGTYGFIYNGLKDDPEDRGKGVKKLTWFTTQLLMEKIKGRLFVSKVGNVYNFTNKLTIVWIDKNEPPIKISNSYPTKITSAITDIQGQRMESIIPASKTITLTQGAYFIEGV